VKNKINWFIFLQPDVEAGDLVFILQQEDHDDFQRTGDNLVMTKTISLTESLCGFQFVIRHLDGRNLVISRAPGNVVPSGLLYSIIFS
jgi:DnaJ family protein A protein 2